MKWVYLLASIGFEVLATTCLKLSSQPGPNSFYYGIAVFVFYIMCFVFLGQTMKYFEVGALYAIWSGLGTVLIAGIGFVVFGDVLTPLKLFSLLLVVLGVIGLQLSGISH